MKVQLTRFEVFAAAMVGVRRRLASMGPAYAPGADFWRIDIEGACAEQAVAKALGVYWDSSVNTFKLPDLPASLQVRHTELDNGSLIVRPGDADGERFLLVTGRAPVFHLRGWLHGYEAKQRYYLKSPNGKDDAYFVPQSALHPLGDLRLEVHRDTETGTVEPSALMRHISVVPSSTVPVFVNGASTL
jgi:hypothetical protein